MNPPARESARFLSLSILALTVSARVGAPQRAFADSILNGGFESPTLSPGEARLFTPGQLIGAWRVVGNAGANVYLLQTTYSEPFNNVSHFNAEEGLNSVDLSGSANTGPSAGVTQVVATSAGGQYTLSFFVGRTTPNNGPSGHYATPATVDLSLDAGPRVHFTNPDVTNGGINWKAFSYSFTAAANSTSITFLNGTTDNNLAGLDNVSMQVICGITQQPASTSSCPSGMATFSIAAAGTGPISYQWQMETSPGTWASLGNDPMPMPCGGFAFATPLNSATVNIGVRNCLGPFNVRCLVTLPCGDLLSDPAVLNVLPSVATDLDLDCDVDGDDLALLRACMSGAGIHLTAGCAGRDFDHDNDVDMDDFGRFQRCYSGSGRTPAPNCEN